MAKQSETGGRSGVVLPGSEENIPTDSKGVRAQRLSRLLSHRSCVKADHGGIKSDMGGQLGADVRVGGGSRTLRREEAVVEHSGFRGLFRREGGSIKPL